MNPALVLASALIGFFFQAPAAGDLQQRIDRLTGELGSNAPEVREQATRELISLGKPALEPMKKLADSGKDVEIRGRAAHVVKEIQIALRPKIYYCVLSARQQKEADKNDAFDEWIRKAVADAGCGSLKDEGKGWVELPEARSTIFPAEPPRKPGGFYVYGQILGWTPEGIPDVEITNCLTASPGGRFTLGPRDSTRLLRLTEHPSSSLFIALKRVDR